MGDDANGEEHAHYYSQSLQFECRCLLYKQFLLKLIFLC